MVSICAFTVTVLGETQDTILHVYYYLVFSLNITLNETHCYKDNEKSLIDVWCFQG